MVTKKNDSSSSVMRESNVVAVAVGSKLSW